MVAVEAVDGTDIRCRVITGGELRAHKGINLPTRSVDAPILTDKDRADLAFGLQQGVDYVALSFVRTAADVAQVREAIAEQCRDRQCTTPLIAKIEKHEALENLDEILAGIDGLMVARGDLGVEIPVERVPGVQKMFPVYPCSTRDGMLPEWSMCAWERIITSMLAGSKGRLRLRSKLSALRPW